MWNIEALTDIWTGDIDRKGARLVSSGLLGSVRWWLEVLVRGLGGYACDPTTHSCKDDTHCVVCELFGCTGWARKFRFDVLHESRLRAVGIKKGNTFSLRFTPMRAVWEDEWRLIATALRLIAKYGALGGKTVLKPSEQNDDSRRHGDYGLIRIKDHGWSNEDVDESLLKLWVNDRRWGRGDTKDFDWASIANLWFVEGRYLSRQDNHESAFNRIIGRPEPKCAPSQGGSWLAGTRGTSKKVFSFKDPPRTFGFVQDASEVNQIYESLHQVWGPGFSRSEFLSGDEILKKLIGERDNK